MLENIQNAFANASTNNEKVKILSLLPHNWSIEKIVSLFEGATIHIIQRSKSNENESVFDINSPRTVGRPSLSVNVGQKILGFYDEDEISRPFPGSKDSISIKLPDQQRKKYQKRLLLAPLFELHQKYLETCVSDEEKVALSTFVKLRPKYCVFTTDSSALNVCVCMICKNMEFYIEALKKIDVLPFETLKKSIKEIVAATTESIICKNPTDACYLRECDECDSSGVIDNIALKLDEKNISKINFSLWVASPRCEIKNDEDDVDLFLDRFKMHLEKYIVHDFKVKMQLDYIRQTKHNLATETEVMVQADFAENFSCFSQDAIQSEYFNRQQVTLHPFVVFYRANNNSKKINTLSVVIISSIRQHRTITVYAFQKQLINILKKKFPLLSKIIYISDGSAEQYKNKFNFKNLACHKTDFDIDAEWHFFPTSHGKGPCDGIGGTVKRHAKSAIIAKTAQINNASQFYDWALKAKTRWEKADASEKWFFVYVDEHEYSSSEAELCDRFSKLQTLPGTHSYHCIIPNGQNHVYASAFSGREENVVLFSLTKIKKEKKEKQGKRKRSK